MFCWWLLSLSGRKGQRSYPGAPQGSDSGGSSIARVSERTYRSHCPSRRTGSLHPAGGGGISASFSRNPPRLGAAAAGIVFQGRHVRGPHVSERPYRKSVTLAIDFRHAPVKSVQGHVLNCSRDPEGGSGGGVGWGCPPSRPPRGRRGRILRPRCSGLAV